MTLAFIAIAVLVTVIYQSYITTRVLGSHVYSQAQKRRQVALVWLVPMLGAAIIHAFLASDSELPVRPDERFTPQPPNDAGIGGH